MGGGGGVNAGEEMLQELCLAPACPLPSPACTGCSSPCFLTPCFLCKTPSEAALARFLVSTSQNKKLSGPRRDTTGMG